MMLYLSITIKIILIHYFVILIEQLNLIMTIDQLIEQALLEDLGDGDHTSLATIPENSIGKAVMFAKEAGILAGTDVVKKVFLAVDPETQIRIFIPDGRHIKPGDKVLEVEGKTQSILLAERTALNFVQRMSGIATFTNKVVRKLEGLKTRVLDTRKTTPANRIVEKLAVKIGGGYNHRFGLYDMIMIKDNHVDFAGGIKKSIDATNKYLKENDKHLKIEIEVRNFQELREVVETGGVDRIMLDNFEPDNLLMAVQIINRKFETEASGGITINNIREYAETGVDFISVGALTHQINSLDLSLKAIK